MTDANQNFSKVVRAVEMQHDALRQKMIDAAADTWIEENMDALPALAK